MDKGIFSRGVVPVLTALLLGAACPAYADIYMYVDEDGVFHFSNTPTSGKYRLYMRERGRRAAPDTGRFDDIIRSAASRHGVEFPLIKAMIKVESNFDPRAVSRKGAKGLMQIMPENFARLNISDPFNPRQNIMGGSYYFKQMLDRFDGKLSLALAAYNAGPTRVEQLGAIPPYPETRDYVKKVMRYYRRFKG